MKYKLNIQLFADTKTVTGSGTKTTTTTYKPNYWQYSTNGSTWYNLRSASTSGSITNQTRLKNLVDYGSKINSWTGTSTTSTTYNSITLPAYPTKVSTSTTENESASVFISGLKLTDTVTGDGWEGAGTNVMIQNTSSSRTKTTTISYTPNGYYDNDGQATILMNELVGTATVSLDRSDGGLAVTYGYVSSFEIIATKINKTNRQIDLELWQYIRCQTTDATSYYTYYTPPFAEINVYENDNEDHIAILDSEHSITENTAYKKDLLINQAELGTYTYNEDGTLNLTLEGIWGGDPSSMVNMPESNIVYYPAETAINETIEITDLDLLEGITTGTRYGGAGDSYTPTSQTMTMYVQYDESTSTSYSAYSSITLPYITRSGYVVEGYYSGSTKVGGEGDTYTPTSSSIILSVKFAVSTKIYIKDSGNIKEISSCYYKENGSWVSKTIDEMYTILNDLTYYKDGG